MNPKPAETRPATAGDRHEQDEFLDAVTHTAGGPDMTGPPLAAVPRSHETMDGDDPTHPTHDMDADSPLPEDVEDEMSEDGRAELTAERIENGEMGTHRRTPADDI